MVAGRVISGDNILMYPTLILFPFLAVIILNLPFRPLMRKAAFGICIFLLAWQVCLSIFTVGCPWANLTGFPCTFLRMDLTVDLLSRLLLFSIALVLLVGLFVQRHIIKDPDRIFNFSNVLLLALAGLNGTVMVKDIFSLYVFLEITAVASFILIVFNEELPALEGVFKYIILSVVATVLMLSSIAILFMFTGDTSFSSIALTLKNSTGQFLITLAIGLFICALFIKGGLVPFHGWLPDVYSEAPASVSVLLAGIVTKTAGIYTLIRLVSSVFGFGGSIKYILLAVGALSAVIGALAALGQSDSKRMLAYSSISQVGYIILGLGCGTALGLAGAVFHLFNHVVFKSLLFVNSAAVELEAGTRDMDKVSGLSKKMPVTGLTSVLGSLSCAGIPPLAGFWSKLMIIIALWLAGFKAYAIIAILVSILTLSYLLSWQRRVFFGKLKEGFEEVREAGIQLVLPAAILAAITVAVGLLSPFAINTFVMRIGSILGG